MSETALPENNVLRLEHITMQFGGVVAVNDLTLDVNLHEIVALIGPNGAGKTTAFNCVTGIYEPTNGRVWFKKQLMLSNRPQGKMKKLYTGDFKPMDLKPVVKTPDVVTKLGIARTFQNIRLFHNLTVFDNVLIAKHMRAKQNVFSATLRMNRAEEKRMRDETTELLSMQGLLKYKDDIASSLPYGLQRRMGNCPLPCNRTQPSLLDERLQEESAGNRRLSEFIKQIRDQYNLTIFMIEHHMDLVMQISDRIYVLDFGRQIAQGTPDEIQNNPKVIDAYLGVGDEDA